MEIKFTKEPQYLYKWDSFIKKNDKGSHLQLSDWLISYKNYGFDFELCLALENDIIIGGYGVVIAKFLFFKFYIIPYGPIVNEDSHKILKPLIDSIPERAKKIKACYCQLNFPYSNNTDFSNHYYTSFDTTFFKKYIQGDLFKFVYSSNGLNWIDLKKYTTTEELLLNFKTSVRRDIRSSLRKEQEIRFLTTEDEIKKGYDLCLENAKNNNYSLRDWTNFKPTLISLISKGNAKFIAAYKENDLKGAILLIKAGNYYTYILGGTKKEKPDLLTGHRLQWEAMILSINEKCDGYNISLGGSDGVQNFKNSFNTTTINFNQTKYYIVLNSIVLNFFLFFDKKIKPYKKNIAKILTHFKHY